MVCDLLNNAISNDLVLVPEGHDILQRQISRNCYKTVLCYNGRLIRKSHAVHQTLPFSLTSNDV